MGSYKYSPLFDGQIRVLELLSSKESQDPLECKIRHITLDDSPQYAALSYTWGDSSLTSLLVVEGLQLHISKSLESALRHFRQRPGEHILWADAVCINQIDLEERSSQVQQMKMIYEKADIVVAWLGPEADNSDLAMDKMSQISDFMARRKAELGSYRLVLANVTQDDVFGSDASDEQVWVAINRYFDRDWWFRTWIIQEATAIDSTILVCGEKAVSMHAIDMTVYFFGTLAMRPGLELLHEIGFGGGSRLLNFKIHRRTLSSDFVLLELLADTRKSEAGDPRDKVFAMLPFATDVQPGILKPDYSKSIYEVYTSLVMWSVYTHRNLDFLGLCSPTPDGQDPEFPSWLPDWRDRTEQVPFAKRLRNSDGVFTKVYDASGSSLPFEPQDGLTILPISNKRVFVRGFCLDYIRTCLEVSTHHVDTSVERSWAPDNGQSLYSFTGETMQEAYLRTIVADVSNTGARQGSRGFAMVWPKKMGFEQRSEEEQEKHGGYMAALKNATVYRRFIITLGTMVGLAPHDTQRDDQVFIFLGGQVPYVLRPKEGDVYQFIGEVYLHGMMDGEAMKILDDNKEKFESQHVQIQPILLE